MEEISRNKAQLAEFEVQIEARNKEIKYLQRALESVYTRFQTYRDEIETTTVPPSAEATVMDVTAMTTRTLEALAERDRRIAELTEQLKGIRPSTLAGLRIETPTTRADESLPSTRSPPTSTAVPIPGGRAAVPPPPPPPPPPLRNASTPAAAVASQPESISNGKVAKLSGFGDIKVVRQAPQPPGQAHPAVSTTTPTIAANVGAAKSVPPPPPLPPQRMVSTERSGLPGKQALVAAPPPPPVPAGASSSARVPPPPGPPPLLRPVIKVSAPAVRAKLKVRLHRFANR